MSGDLISREAAAQMLMEKSYSYVVSLFPTYDECKTAREIAKECAEAVRQMEAVGAVEVVRCKDCAHARALPEDSKPYFKDDIMVCAWGRGDSIKGQSVVWPDEFCSCGVKMDGGADG